MRSCIGGCLLTMLLATSAGAGVIRYDLRYTFVYQQTSPTPPTTPGVYVWSSRVDLEESGDASLASVTTPGNIGAFLFPVGESSFLASRSFASEASMNWSFPAGSYTITIAGGTLGGIAAALNRPAATFYPQAIPTFTPASLNAIAAAPVTIPWPLTFNSFSLPPGANSGQTVLRITTESGTEIFSAPLVAGASGVLIPANTMLPATNYRLRLAFSAQQANPSTGFPGATAFVAFDRETIYAFGTRAACKADLTGDTIVDDADFVIFSEAYQILLCADASMPSGCPADLVTDGLVDDTDFVVFSQAYEALVCP